MSRKKVQENIAYDDVKHLFYVYFSQKLETTGKRKRFTKTFTTLEEAQKSLDWFEREEGRVFPLPDDIKLEDWLNYWLEDVVALNLEYTTYYCYRNIVKNHIAPILGRIKLKELTPFRVQQYYTEMTRQKGLSPNTVHKHHILLHTALKLAFRQGILPVNPIDRVTPPKERETQRAFYTPQQLKCLLQTASGTNVELIVKLAGYLGLRRGEICGLRWEDVNFQEKVISIRRTRTTAGVRVVEKAPKSGNSIRRLSIEQLDDLLELLAAVKTRQRSSSSGGEGGYVLTQSDGGPLHPNMVTQQLSDFVKERNLPPITVHGLRHTFASVANSVHIPLPDISKALGHRDVVVTGRIYTHIFDQTHSEAVNAVARCIRGV